MQVEQDIPSSCQFRVCLYGPLEVWKREASGNWQLVEKQAWGKGKAARSVLKRLLVAPGRRLSRGALQDDLWPETEDFELADKTIYNAVNQIRRVVGKTLVRTIETTYEVADQSVIWVDRDACEALLKKVENWGYASIEALPLLEQALAYLERGELLEGESGTWVYALRKKSEDLLRQCRFWLAEGYETQGKLWQAGELYRVMVLRDLSDEDALQNWIKMLARHGKRQEALKCYQEMKGLMVTQGFLPSNGLEQMVASLSKQPPPTLFSPTQPPEQTMKNVKKTYPSLLCLPSQHTSDTFLFFDNLLQEGKLPIFPSARSGFPIHSSTLGQQNPHGIEPISQETWFAFQQTRLLADILQGQDPSDEVLQRRLNDEFLRFVQTTSVSSDESSNQLLLNIAILPLTRLESQQQSHVEDVLRQCVASLVACQHLLRRGNFFHVRYVLTHMLPVLTMFSYRSSPHQKRAASLASQGYRLANILALHHDNLELKEYYCKQALQYSFVAEDHALSVAALKGLAVTFYYRNTPSDAKEAYIQALQDENHASSLLRSCVSIGLAQAYAQCGQEKAALEAIEQAHAIFPEHPETDVSFLYADFDHTQLILWEGLTYLALGHYHLAQNKRPQSQLYHQKAWETFAAIEQKNKHIPSTARDRTDILNHMSTTALVLDDPQRFCSYLEQGMKETVVLGSKKRKKELIATYTQGRKIWPQNTALKAVGDAILAAILTEDSPTS